MIVWWSNRALIRHLEEEIAYLRDQHAHERRRYEEAINALLAARGVPAALTTYSQAETERARAPMEMAERLMRDTEFMSAGE